MDYSKSGFVYVLQMEGHPYYKIGRTVNVDRRISQISPQMPGRLILLFAHRVLDAWRMERVLHDDFKDRRLNGEWFYLEPVDITEIKRSMLTDQAHTLYQRLLTTMTAGHREASPVRLSHALYKASLRTERRFAQYSDLHWCRHGRDCSKDAVLESEFVG